MLKRILYIFPLVVLMLLGLFFWHGLKNNPRYLQSVLIGHKLPNFQAPALFDKTRLSVEDLPHKMLLLNVFASWCGACNQEQNFLVSLAKDKSIALYGIDFQDQQAAAQQYLNIRSNPYQSVFQDQDGAIAIALGVWGAPESFLIAPDKTILAKYEGALTEQIWQQKFVPVIAAYDRQQAQGGAG